MEFQTFAHNPKYILDWGLFGSHSYHKDEPFKLGSTEYSKGKKEKTGLG